MVRHRWPSGARLIFNCYHHQALLLVRADDSYAGHCLWSREGLTQGEPLKMILYGFGMLPLTLTLKAAVPRALQPCYAEDAAAGENFDELLKVLSLLQIIWPARGYFPEPTKYIHMVKHTMVE